MCFDNTNLEKQIKNLDVEESKELLMTAKKKNNPYQYSAMKSSRKTLNGIETEAFDENEFFDAVEEL